MLCVLITFFFPINVLLSNAIKKDILEYGGINRASKTYTITMNNNFACKELQIIISLINKYEILEVKDILLKIEPLKRMKVKCSNGIKSPFDVEKIQVEGRVFTEKEINDGDLVILLSVIDHATYFSENSPGDYIQLGNHKFYLVGISYAHQFSIIPLNALFNNEMFQDQSVKIGQVDLYLNQQLKKSNIHHMKTLYQDEMKIFTNNKEFQSDFNVKGNIWEPIYNLYNDLLDYFVILLICMLISIICIAQTCTIIFYKNEKLQNMILISGGTYKYLKKIIRLELMVTVIIALIISCCILKIGDFS